MAQDQATSYHADPKVDALVNDIIARVADKWTFLVIEALEEAGDRRFSELWRDVPNISQKMLTQTLRGLEREGLVIRTVFAEVPPRVEYRLTQLGHDLAEAFCGVWQWAETNIDKIEAARRAYDGK